MRPANKTENFIVRLAPSDRAALVGLAEAEDRTMASAIRIAIREAAARRGITVVAEQPARKAA